MVEYDFYIDTYKGESIAVEEFPLFEARAAEQLARYKRIYTVTAPEEDAEAMAVCAMADAIAEAVNADVVGVVGRKVILYREAVNNKKIEL